MIDKNTAREIALAKIINQDAYNFNPLELVIQDEETQEEDFGWIFFYQSKRYVETGNWRDMAVGNAPIIVSRQDGSTHGTGTARPIEDYIAQYQDLLSGKIEKRAF